MSFLCAGKLRTSHAKDLNSELWNVGPLSDFITSGMPLVLNIVFNFGGHRIGRCGPNDFHFWKTTVFVYRD